MKKMNLSIETMTLTAIFSAVICILSAIPLGINIMGVPATLQVFAIALTGFLLPAKPAVLATAIYILLGFIGFPVYNSFQAGPSVLLGSAGGFLFGFLPLSFFCSIYKKKTPKKSVSFFFHFLFAFIGLLLCHILGILQFSFLHKMNFMESALFISLPYVAKDIFFICLAFCVADMIKRRTSLF